MQRFLNFNSNPPMKSFESYKEVLLKYTTPEIADYIVQTFNDFPYQFVISSPRSSKLGDYSPPFGNRHFHRISVNGNLNTYSFFVTFLHELAHLKNWLKYKNRVKSHGDEWKSFYIDLLKDALKEDFFPIDLKKALEEHITQVKSSTTYDYNLITALGNHDANNTNDNLVEVGSLNNGDFFVFQNRTFQYDKLLRKRISCLLMPDKRKYSFSPIAKVKPLHHSQKN